MNGQYMLEPKLFHVRSCYPHYLYLCIVTIGILMIKFFSQALADTILAMDIHMFASIHTITSSSNCRHRFVALAS